MRYAELGVSVLADTNILVALAVVALHRFVAVHLGLTVSWPTDLVIGGSTLVLYGVDRLFDRVVEGERRATRARGLVGASTVLGVVLSLVGLAYSSQAVRVLVGFGSFVSLMYGLPLKRRQGVRRWSRLKDVPGIKSWMVAAAVSIAVVTVPLVTAGAPFDQRVLVLFGMLFALTAANALLFDLRDVEWDRRLEVPSVPVVRGTAKARCLVVMLLLCAMAFAMCADWLGAGPTPLGIVLAATVALPLAMRGGPHTPRLLWPLVADGALVLPWLVSRVAGG